MEMMYFHAILFVFISCALYPYHKSSVTSQENNGDGNGLTTVIKGNLKNGNVGNPLKHPENGPEQIAGKKSEDYVDPKKLPVTVSSATETLSTKEKSVETKETDNHYPRNLPAIASSSTETLSTKEKSVETKETEDENVVLSQDTIETINNCFNGQTDPNVVNNVKQIMLEKKRLKTKLERESKKNQTKLEREFKKNQTQLERESKKNQTKLENKLIKVQQENFYPLLFCAVSTIKTLLNKMTDDQILWKKIDLSQLDYSERLSWKHCIILPKYIFELMLKYDGPPPFNKTMTKHMEYHINRFRTLYIRLKRDDYEKSDFFKNLRHLINASYAPRNDEELDEVYKQFAATITRDNRFLAAQHHNELGIVLNNIMQTKSSKEKDVLDHMLKVNPNWFMDEKHIKNLNILRQAYHGEDKVSEIFGYKCKNGRGQDIEIPLLDDCGFRKGFTYRPAKLKVGT